MPYHVAIPQGDKFIIASKESFNVRSNALAYAKRMGWEKTCFICTSEQKALIEAGADFGEASASSDIIPPEPETVLMKEKDVPSGQRPRKLKRK